MARKFKQIIRTLSANFRQAMGEVFVPQRKLRLKKMAAEAAADAPEVVNTIITEGTRVLGNLTSDSDIEIAGVIEGDITSDNKVVVSGKVYGDIQCSNAEICGAHVEGNVMV